MIEKNYIILAFNRPNQLFRLIQRLDDGFSKFYVHVDINSEINDFSILQNNKIIHIMNDRVPGTWGDFSIVQATINCIKTIINEERKAYTILLSGQCYPIASTFKINNYIKQNSSIDHINLLGAEKCWKNYKDRLFKYKINLSNQKEDYTILPSMLDTSIKMNLKNFKRMVNVSIERKKINLLIAYFKTFTRRKSPIANHFGGSQWWALSFETLFKVHTFIENNTDFVSYHKNTLLPDELFFHTIVSYLMKNDNSITVKNAFTYVNWSRNEGKFPVVFNESDYDELLQQAKNNMLFARKFDMDYCNTILNLLDNQQVH